MYRTLSEPLSKAMEDVFGRMLDLDVSISINESQCAASNEENTVNIVISIKGDLSGEILYSFPKSTALEIVKIMTGMEFNEVDEFVTSALSEIANIIAGNTATGLSQKMLACDIDPPKLLPSGEKPGNQPNMVMKVDSAVGQAELDITVK